MRCEKFVNEYLSAVRADIAYILYKEYDMTQVEISHILDISQPAVSQYIYGERGKTTDLPDHIENAIEEVCKDIYRQSEAQELTQEKIDDMICEICKKI